MKENNRLILSHTAQIVLFAMLGTLMFVGKVVMNGLYNIHPVGVLTMVYTLVFRWKGLIPIYVYAALVLFDFGFTLYWIPNLFIWTVLWAATMLLPRNMPKKVAVPVYSVVCALHGLFYGTLWAPFHAWLNGLDAKGMLTWIIMGLFPADVIHMTSNFFLGSLVFPLSVALRKAIKAS